MAAPVYRAGIVGLGFIGGADQVSGDAIGQLVSDLDGTHFGAFEDCPRIDLVAGSSRDEGRRSRFRQRCGATVYADWNDMLAAESLDVVSVATYTPYHADITLACAEHGVKAVYCEKPIASRPMDADRMIAACGAAGTLLVINHNRRFNPNYRRLREHVAAGALGELTSANLQWGSGRLGNVGTHVIDALLMLTGQRIAAVSGLLDLTGRPDCRGPQFHDPGGWGLIRFDSGMVATVDAADSATLGLSLTLNGTKASAVTGCSEVTLDYRDGQQERWSNPRQDGTSMDRAAGEIVEWLDGAGPFPYDAEEAAHTLEAIAALHCSHERNGAWIELPLAAEDKGREVKSG